MGSVTHQFWHLDVADILPTHLTAASSWCGRSFSGLLSNYAVSNTGLASFSSPCSQLLHRPAASLLPLISRIIPQRRPSLPIREVFLDALVAVRGLSLLSYQLGTSNGIPVHNVHGFPFVKTLVFGVVSAFALTSLGAGTIETGSYLCWSQIDDGRSAPSKP